MIFAVSCLKGPRFIKSDLNLMQLIKAGKEGVFYQARMTRGTCKGHGMFTCKLSKEGENRWTGYTGQQNRYKGWTGCFFSLKVSVKNTWRWRFPSWGNWCTIRTSSSYWTGTPVRVRRTHLSFQRPCCSPVKTPPSVCVEPYILIMEYVSYGTLRTFLQTHRSHLSIDPELQSLLTIASYHIALAMQHLRSKMVTTKKGFMHLSALRCWSPRLSLQIVHCDLALRNIMVNKFPWEVKVAEFGLARDLTRMTSRRSSRWRSHRVGRHAFIL